MARSAFEPSCDLYLYVMRMTVEYCLVGCVYAFDQLLRSELTDFQQKPHARVMHLSFLYGHGEDGTMLRRDVGTVLDDLVKLHGFVDWLHTSIMVST